MKAFDLESVTTSFKRSTDNVDYGEFAKYGNIYAVYEIKCIETDKSYIGSTKDLARRLMKHFSELRFDRHTSIGMQEDFNKYGFDKFIINIRKTFDNIVDNDTLIKEETIILKSIYDISGITLLYNEKITGIYISERLNSIYASSTKESHKTDEYRAKMVKLKTKYAIAKFDIYGRFIETFDSAELIVEKYPDYKPNVIRGVCNGSKKSYKGYIWKYVEN